MNVEGIRIDHWAGGVYAPAEDTLLLLRSVTGGKGRFLDVGTGTGIIGIKACSLGYDVVSTDVDGNALAEASMNAEENSAEISFVQCDLLSCFSCMFDIIAFNPPYLMEDGVPDRQLAGGPRGVELAVEFLKQAAELLSPEGEVLVVLSSLGDTDWFRSKVSEQWSIELGSSVRLEFETLMLFSARLRRLSPE